MKDFRLFDISDFVMDEDFIRWVKEKRKEDNDFWDNWLSQHPDKYMNIAEARRVVESMETEEGMVTENEIDKEVDKLLYTIKEQTEQPKAPVRRMIISKKWWYAAAGLIVAVSTLSVFLLVRSGRSGEFAYAAQTSSRHLKECINSSEEAITLSLPDGSVVELAANSRISYANNFDSSASRDIYLSGEAFFNVTKNPSRPFRVFANEIVSKVVGTSFSVRSFDRDSVIQVTVRTGKVSVYSQAATNAGLATATYKPGEIMVIPNQQLIYKKDDRSFQKLLLKDPVMTEPFAKGKSMGYEEAPLTTVFKELSAAYEINIVFDSELLKHCTITADLAKESFYEKLDLICRAIGATYEIIDGQIIIQTNGCQSN